MIDESRDPMIVPVALVLLSLALWASSLLMTRGKPVKPAPTVVAGEVRRVA